MEIKVHDILRFESLEKLKTFSDFPDWIGKSPQSMHYGVVRRMSSSNNLIPIGIRGETREQRFGSFLHTDNVCEVITPISLVQQIENFQEQIYFDALKCIREEFAKYKLSWGPTGSVGFEMATSFKVTSDKSDIDISIYMDEVNGKLLMEIQQFLEGLNRRVDVQVEIPQFGAFILNDFVKNHQHGIIVRTPFGPQLWNVLNGDIRLA